MPYVVLYGEVHMNGAIYKVGDAIPAMKGSLSDIAAIGSIEWQNAAKEETSEPKPKPVHHRAVKK